MIVGILQLDILIHDSNSLKAKRGTIRKIVTRVKNTFEVSVAEVDSQDLWQRAQLGIAVVGNDRSVLNQKLDHVLNFVESLGAAEIIDHKIELINL